jgi:hypothetical protein
MNSIDRDADAARSAAGHNAYRIVEEFGIDDGTMLLKAVSMTYLRSLAAVIGWQETLGIVREQYEGHFVPPRGQEIKLVHSRGAA